MKLFNKRLLGTLKVYIEDDVKGRVSNLEQVATQDFVLTLNPSADKTEGHELLGSKTADILAHELGHFVARSLGSPGEQFQRATGGLVPSELEAWQIAEHIKGNIDVSVVKEALDTYVKGELYRAVADSLGPIGLKALLTERLPKLIEQHQSNMTK